MLEIIQSITQWLLPISALLAVIALIIENSKKIAAKPISKIFSWIGRAMNKDSQEDLAHIKEGLVQLNAKVEQRDAELYGMFNNLSDRIDVNESDRIRAEIFGYGRIARTHGYITTEEWRHIQDVYYKYHNVLKGNGQVTEEYEYIKQYYYSQFEEKK